MLKKNYLVTNLKLFNLEVKKIHYDFKVDKLAKPTKFIRIIIHHTGNKQKSIQDIIDLHVKKNHWSTIGYHFTISKSGNIYYTRDLKYAGAHTYHHNRNSIGIALFGEFNEEKPTEKQVESLRKLVKTLKENYEIKEILGHNEAIYKYVKGKYHTIKLPEINPIEIKTQKELNNFTTEITTEILKHDASSEAIKTIKRIKSCPGLNMYEIVKKIK